MRILNKFLIISFAATLSFAQKPVMISSLPEGFIDVKEKIPSIILDLRYFTDYNFIGKPINGYIKPKCVMTKEAAEGLKRVQNELLEFSLSLKIYDAYRPQRAVDHFVEWAKDISDTLMKKAFYPTVDKKNLFRDGYIAERSSHSRGSTVDLTIISLPPPDQKDYSEGDKLCNCNRQMLDSPYDNSINMGGGFDCFHPVSHTINLQLKTHQRINRLLLKTLMEKHGFKNYSKEWWHYTLKSEPYPETYFDFPIQ